MSIVYPSAGKAAFLKTLLDDEVHLAIGTGNTPLAGGAVNLTTPLIRKRVFDKGYAADFKSRALATFGFTSDTGDNTGGLVTQIATRFAGLRNIFHGGNICNHPSYAVGHLDIALAMFETWITSSRFFPVLGNKDQDYPFQLSVIRTKFPYLNSFPSVTPLGGNSRWYAKNVSYDGSATVIAHVSFYNAGRNSENAEMENAALDSEQSVALRQAANNSNAPWKILVIGQPPVTGGEGWLEEVTHLLDGTWDLVLSGAGGFTRAEEIDANGLARLLVLSASTANAGSGDLEGGISAGIAKTWEHDTAKVCGRFYLTADTLLWEIVNVETGALLRSETLRKPDAPFLHQAVNGVKYYLTTTPTNTVLLTAVIDPDDLPDGTEITQIGLYVGGRATIAPGEDSLPLNTITTSGSPVALEDGLTLIHSTATFINITRAIKL